MCVLLLLGTVNVMMIAMTMIAAMLAQPPTTPLSVYGGGIGGC